MPAEPETAGPVRVFLVDDHRVVRRGVTAYLEQIDDMEVVGEAGDGQQALERIALLEPGGNLPDVVLMDLMMPVMDGITATRQVKSRWPAVEVVAVTSFVEEAKVRGALEAGAARYLLKDADADQVAQAIRAALGQTIALEADLVMVADAADADAALAVAERTDPSIVLVEVLLPDHATGLALVGRLARRPGCAVVAMSIRAGLRTDALAAGAVAFVEKGGDVDALLGALRAAAAATQPV